MPERNVPQAAALSQDGGDESLIEVTEGYNGDVDSDGGSDDSLPPLSKIWPSLSKILNLPTDGSSQTRSGSYAASGRKPTDYGSRDNSSNCTPSLAKTFRVPPFKLQESVLNDGDKLQPTSSVSSNPKRESSRPSINAPSRRSKHHGRSAPTLCKRRPFVELNKLYGGPRGLEACHQHSRAACQEITNRQKTFKRGLFVDNDDGEGGKPLAKKRKTP